MVSATKDLRQFLSYVTKNEPSMLAYVKRGISRRYEISALVRNLGASIGVTDHPSAPALVCENVDGYGIPVVTNLFGSRRMLAMALGVDEGGIDEKIVASREHPVPPKEVGSGQVHEVVHRGKDARLSSLPIVTHCEGDAGPYVTAGAMILHDKAMGKLNMGIYRMMLQNERELVVNLGQSHDGYRIFKEAEAKGRDLETVVFIGHHPAVYMSSQSYDPNQSELSFAGALLGEPLALAQCKTVTLPVPAAAEVSIEGKLIAGKRKTEGPFGEYAGYYSGTTEGIVFRVSAVTRRRDAMYLDIYNAGVEHNVLHISAIEAQLYWMLKRLFPTYVLGVRVPPPGIGHLAYVSVRGGPRGIAKNLGMVATSFPYIKVCVVVDADVDIQNQSQVTWAVMTRADPSRSFTFVPDALGHPGDPMAHGEDRSKKGRIHTKLIVDATAPTDRDFPAVESLPQRVLDRVTPRDYIQGYAD